MLNEKWQILSTSDAPIKFVEGVEKITGKDAKYCAQLLWQRGIEDLDKLPGFLDPNKYQPASPFAFGTEMECAMSRLQKARRQFGEGYYLG